MSIFSLKTTTGPTRLLSRKSGLENYIGVGNPLSINLARDIKD